MVIKEIETEVTVDEKSIYELVDALKDYLNNVYGIRYEITIVENENLARD